MHREVENTLKELIQLVSSFNQEQINTIPFEGSWTAGQLGRHMIKSNSGFVEMLNGPVKDSGREPDKMVERIKEDFLDFNTKMKSPDFIVPENINYNKEALLSSLNNIKVDLNKAVLTLDLTKTCLVFELPVYGALTRLEAIYFVIYHTQRHIHQLKNIFQKVVNKQKRKSEIQEKTKVKERNNV